MNQESPPNFIDRKKADPEGWRKYIQSAFDAKYGWRLSRFPLFTAVCAVWQGNGKDRLKNAEQVRQMMTTELRDELIQAVKKGDATTFRLVANTLDLLKAHPGMSKDPFYAIHKWDYWLRCYYINRESATIDALITYCVKMMSLELDDHTRVAYDQQIRRRCKRLKLKIATSKRGTKPGAKRHWRH